jgi:predicted transcriptional regulator
MNIEELEEPLRSFAEKVYNEGIKGEYDRITNIMRNSKGSKRLEEEDVRYDTIREKRIDLCLNLTGDEIREIFKFKI